MMVRRVVPMGTSTRPVLLILPPRANTLVPLLFSVPMLANQSAPFRMIWATLA
jgi:mRNA-degrading endonuclease toxin of MazEF toxin-antitoxin module